VRRDSSSPQAYRDDVDDDKREMLDTIRAAILEVAPDAVEGIEHGMLDYPGLANLAAQKDYVALYVAPAVLAVHKARFPGVNAGKSCLRFRKSSQLDREALIHLLREVRSYREAQ
jgi:uncharacterized protein YdhG (YjbR/CyaY superfamily)